MAGYRVTKLKEDTHVSYWPDPRGAGHGECEKGTVYSHFGDTVVIEWYGGTNAGVGERWTAGDVRYRIDRGQMFLKAPPKPRRVRLSADKLICKQCGTPRKEGCDCPRRGAVKPEEWGNKSRSCPLTRSKGFDSIDPIINERSDDAPVTTKGTPIMAKTKDKAPAAEVEEDQGPAPLSAKEAAKELGTDARTLRKFLRKKNGLVGQGQRWEIDRSDLKTLKAEFAAWNKGTGTRGEGKTKKVQPPADDAEELDFEVDEDDEDTVANELEELDLDDDDDDLMEL